MDRRKQQRAWRAENKAVPHNNVAKHGEKEDGAEERRPLDTCTVCCLPFFESTTVHAHPELGVALCFYCHDAAEAFAAGGAVTAEQSCLWCGGASERNDDDDDWDDEEFAETTPGDEESSGGEEDSEWGDSESYEENVTIDNKGSPRQLKAFPKRFPKSTEIINAIAQSVANASVYTDNNRSTQEGWIGSLRC